VAVLSDGNLKAGPHERVWDAVRTGNRAAGLYFIRLETPEGRLVRRLVVLN
jgi:hypothetical protein